MELHHYNLSYVEPVPDSKQLRTPSLNESLSALDFDHTDKNENLVISQFTHSSMVKYSYSDDLSNILLSIEHALKEIIGYYLGSIDTHEIIKLGDIEVRSIMSTIETNFDRTKDFRADHFCNEKKRSDDETLSCTKVRSTIQLEHNRKITSSQLNFFLLTYVQRITDDVAYRTNLDTMYVGFEGLSVDMSLYLRYDDDDTAVHESPKTLMNTEEVVFFLQKLNTFLKNHSYNYEVMDVSLSSQKIVTFEEQSHSNEDPSSHKYLREANVTTTSASPMSSSEQLNEKSLAMMFQVAINLQYLPPIGIDPRLLITETFLDKNDELLSLLHEMPYFVMFDSVSLTNEIIDDFDMIKSQVDTSILISRTVDSSDDVEENGMLSAIKSLPIYENKPLFYGTIAGISSLTLALLVFIIHKISPRMRKKTSARIKSLRRSSAVMQEFFRRRSGDRSMTRREFSF